MWELKRFSRTFYKGILLLRKGFYCNKFINWSFNFRFDINFKELIQIFANSVFNWIEPWPPKSPRIQISFNSKSPFFVKKIFSFFFQKSLLSLVGGSIKGKSAHLDIPNVRVLKSLPIAFVLIKSVISVGVYYQYWNFG